VKALSGGEESETVPHPFPAGVDERERRKSRDEVGRLPGYNA